MVNELYHHGIKGQKWGVRRFQNYDGTLKTARQFKGALNKNDQRIAEEKYRAQKAKASLDLAKKKEDRVYKKWDAYAKKHGGAENLSASKSLSISRKLDKATRKRGIAAHKLKEHEANIAAGEEYTDRLMKDAWSKGFSVSSKDTARLANRGEYAAMVLMGAPITAARYAHFEKGSKYNVITQDKAAKKEAKALNAMQKRFDSEAEKSRKFYGKLTTERNRRDSIKDELTDSTINKSRRAKLEKELGKRESKVGKMTEVDRSTQNRLYGMKKDISRRSAEIDFGDEPGSPYKVDSEYDKKGHKRYTVRPNRQ